MPKTFHPSLSEMEWFHLNWEFEHSKSQPAIFRLGLNTYHFGLNHFEPNQIRELLFFPHLAAGLNSAELAEDMFEDESATGDFYRGIPTVNFGVNPPDRLKRIIDTVNETADAQKISIDSMGTGAYLYGRIMKGDGASPLGRKGFYDLPEDEQNKRMAVMQNWINIAYLLLHPKIIGGHRIATTDPAKYSPIGTLEQFAEEFGWQSVAEIDEKTRMSRGEALNINLFIELQKYGKQFGITSTTELLYQNNGIAPITITQMNRMAKLIEANGRQPVFMHMDIGHVIVSANGDQTKEKKDYDLRRYAKDVNWPRWVDHFNNLAYNLHGFPTQEGRDQDRAIAEGRSDLKSPYDCPFPELHQRDVYDDWIKVNMNSCRVHQLTPEPKEVGDLNRMGQKGEEVKELLARELAETHVTDPVFNGYYIPKDMYPDFVKRFSN